MRKRYPPILTITRLYSTLQSPPIPCGIRVESAESALIPRNDFIFWQVWYQCNRGKKMNKILKNAEKSYDHGHAKVSMPNRAKLKIFAKYFFKRSKWENWLAGKKSSKIQKIHVNQVMQELCSQTKPNSWYLQNTFSGACEKIERLPKHVQQTVSVASVN